MCKWMDEPQFVLLLCESYTFGIPVLHVFLIRNQLSGFSLDAS